ANHVAVHVGIAGVETAEYVHRERLEARMYAERQAVAGAANRLEHARQIVGAVARHVQDRSEFLGAQLVQRAQLEQVRRKEMTEEMLLAGFASIQEPRLAPHARRML